MFQVEDVVGVLNGRRGDRYRVISVDPDKGLVLRSVNLTDPTKNFTCNEKFDHLIIDKTYDRRRKLDKIMDNIDSFNIMKKAEQTAELNRRVQWLLMMEKRKRKIQKICSRLEIE